MHADCAASHAGASTTHDLRKKRLVGAIGVSLGLSIFSTTPQAAEPFSIPTAATGIAASHCSVGELCTFAAPIFVCDYASAEKVAIAGSLDGRAVGMRLVADKCNADTPAMATVRGFYSALSSGDGEKASSFVVPESLSGIIAFSDRAFAA